MRERFAQSGEVADEELIARHIGRIVLSEEKILITLKGDEIIPVELIRAPSRASSRARIETDQPDAGAEPDFSFVQAIARAHAWRRALASGAYQSIEELAGAVQWNAKVIRKALRLAFLAPDITEAIIQAHSRQRLGCLRCREFQHTIGMSSVDYSA